MNDWAVFWLMVLLVGVLWWVAMRVHARAERRVAEQWNTRFGADGHGPPRVLP